MSSITFILNALYIAYGFGAVYITHANSKLPIGQQTFLYFLILAPSVSSVLLLWTHSSFFRLLSRLTNGFLILFSLGMIVLLAFVNSHGFLAFAISLGFIFIVSAANFVQTWTIGSPLKGS